MNSGIAAPPRTSASKTGWGADRASQNLAAEITPVLGGRMVRRHRKNSLRLRTSGWDLRMAETAVDPLRPAVTTKVSDRSGGGAGEEPPAGSRATARPSSR